MCLSPRLCEAIFHCSHPAWPAVVPAVLQRRAPNKSLSLLPNTAEPRWPVTDRSPVHVFKIYPLIVRLLAWHGPANRPDCVERVQCHVYPLYSIVGGHYNLMLIPSNVWKCTYIRQAATEWFTWRQSIFTITRMFTTVSISNQSMGRFGGTPKSYFRLAFFFFFVLFCWFVFIFVAPVAVSQSTHSRVTVPQMAFQKFRTGLESKKTYDFLLSVCCCLHFVLFRSSIDTILPFGSLGSDRLNWQRWQRLRRLFALTIFPSTVLARV